MTKELSGFKLIGDINKTKCLFGNGIWLYDFKCIYAEKLDSLAKQFFPKREDLWKGSTTAIIDMTLNVLLKRWP